MTDIKNNSARVSSFVSFSSLPEHEISFVKSSFQFAPDRHVYPDDVTVMLSLEGLRGGNCAEDIRKGNANAIKLLTRVLKDAIANYGARLASFNSKNKELAIPSNAYATVSIPGENLEAFWELVSDYKDMFNQEYKMIEIVYSLTLERIDAAQTLLPEEIQDGVINALEACQNGLISLDIDKREWADTVTNIYGISSKEDEVEVMTLVSGRSESKIWAACSSVESAFALAGAKVEIGD